jgi:aminoglycoside 6'-N-acetyltransferase I
VELRIVDLTPDATDLIDQAAVLLHEAFYRRSESWQDLESAHDEVIESLDPERISRVALNADDDVVGWIGCFPTYRGRVWEVHPLVVARAHRRQGIGTALVRDLEHIVAARGGLTLWLGSDDENGETSLSGVDLYADVPAVMRGFQTLRGDHPGEFYLSLGFRIVGVLPDANGRGKPDIFFAKEIRRGPNG